MESKCGLHLHLIICIKRHLILVSLEIVQYVVNFILKYTHTKLVDWICISMTDCVGWNENSSDGKSTFEYLKMGKIFFRITFFIGRYKDVKPLLQNGKFSFNNLNLFSYYRSIILIYVSDIFLFLIYQIVRRHEWNPICVGT